MKTLTRSFLQGLALVVPISATAYVVYWAVTTIDGLLGVSIPGLGILITVVAITLVGLLASNVLGRRLVRVLEKGIERLPVVKLLYGSIKDLMGAFVGDKKGFERPAMVDVTGDGSVRALGFVTCERFDDPKLSGFVAVYLPQSYNFAGNLLVVPRDRVSPIDADGAQFMAFIVSGGVAEMNAAKTRMDPDLIAKVAAKRR
ncbi:MAG: DUF502 domain-containing protein [Myxococcota bacterium]